MEVPWELLESTMSSVNVAGQDGDDDGPCGNHDDHEEVRKQTLFGSVVL